MQVNMRQSAQRSRSLMLNAGKIKSKANALLAKKLARPKASLGLEAPHASAAASTQVRSNPSVPPSPPPTPSMHARSTTRSRSDAAVAPLTECGWLEGVGVYTVAVQRRTQSSARVVQ
jgi:hypothetical protein